MLSKRSQSFESIQCVETEPEATTILVPPLTALFTQTARSAFNKMCCAVGAENARTGKTMAEKMVKIMEERLKEKVAFTDKLHSKNHALKVQSLHLIIWKSSWCCLTFVLLDFSICFLY